MLRGQGRKKNVKSRSGGKVVLKRNPKKKRRKKPTRKTWEIFR